MAWTTDALERCACGHSQAGHEQRGQLGQVVLLGCGLCGCQDYDPRADAAAARGAAQLWELYRQLRAANRSRERLWAVVAAVRDGNVEAARERLADLRGEDQDPGAAGNREAEWRSAAS